MRSAISVVRIALVMVALGLAVAVVGRPTVSDAAHDVPLPAARTGSPSPGPTHDHGPTYYPNPTAGAQPPPPVVSCGGCVVITAPPTPVGQPNTPPPAQPQPPPATPHLPDNPPPPPPPPPPVAIPVSVVPPAPIDIPTPSPVPTPAPVPVPDVQFTSSVDAGTQALTVILLFVVFGGWFYGNRIASQWSSEKDDHGRVST
jgi:outer membrane biosynthesis protein TonB